MGRGAAGEPSAKRAKVDEADDEDEGRLVRRNKEIVRVLEKASAKGKGNARAKKELLTLCTKLEAKNEKLLGKLPPELWQKIDDEYQDQNDLPALTMTCRFFREKQKDLGRKLEINLDTDHLLDLRNSGKVASHTLGWFRWACDTFQILPGLRSVSKRVEGLPVYEGDLLNCAAFQGSVEILRWLLEEKGWEPNWKTPWCAGLGGSVEILEYLNSTSSYKFDKWACEGAALGGHLNVLKYLRDTLSPPCPWDEWTCIVAVRGGHLDVLKWARSQHPPCPWGSCTSSEAAKEGNLHVLEWLRAQNPPCPWSRKECRAYATWKGHQHVVVWIDQREDESDDEYDYSDVESS